MKKRTVLITGGSQGTGLAIALRFAKEGASVVVAAKDSPEQIQNVHDAIIQAGGKALVRNVDVTHYDELKSLVEETVTRFQGIDILINNTSAPCFNDIFSTTPEQFDLVMFTSVRAAFFLSQLCFPHLRKAPNPHIIHIAPPLNLSPQWFKDHLAFAIGKCAMSLCTLGMAAEFESAGIAVNSLWPKTNIATQRLKDHLAPEVYAGSRWPTIMADATHELARRTFRETTGQCLVDETLLKEAGVTDFSQYAVNPERPLMQTIFIPLETGMTPISRDLFLNRSKSS